MAQKKKTPLTLKIVRETVHHFSDLISKIENDAQQVALNGDLMKAHKAPCGIPCDGPDGPTKLDPNNQLRKFTDGK